MKQKPSNQLTKMISIRISHELVEKLDQAAKRHGISKTKIITNGTLAELERKKKEHEETC